MLVYCLHINQYIPLFHAYVHNLQISAWVLVAEIVQGPTHQDRIT